MHFLSPRPAFVFFKIHFNVTVPSVSWSCIWSLCFSLPHQNSMCIYVSSYTFHISYSSHSPWDYHPNNVGVGYESSTSSFRSLLYSPDISSLAGPDTFLSTPFSKNLSMCSSVNVTEQLSYPYETTYFVLFSSNSLILSVLIAN